MVKHTQEVIRQVDCCARMGGEEFPVLLPDADARTAATVAERLRSALDGSTALAPAGVRVAHTVSIGVATLEPGESLAELIERADAALYDAKAGGRNRVVSAPPTRSAVTVRRKAGGAKGSLG
ncbi:GGDEF domain-containing protein [Massilia sp. Se16.2.3]|nr:GGDEF domain-containing protein [Massilia sp. Se16.2.3]QNB00218.1 GGDEF domain-containing protein [Massilia sp. Se16.2.3]